MIMVVEPSVMCVVVPYTSFAKQCTAFGIFWSVCGRIISRGCCNIFPKIDTRNAVRIQPSPNVTSFAHDGTNNTVLWWSLRPLSPSPALSLSL